MSAALAQVGSTGVKPPIELPEAIMRTLALNPYLVAYGFDIPAAEGRLEQAQFAPSRELNVVVEDALGTGSLSGTRSAETTVTLGWVLERGLRQRVVDTARAGVARSTVELEIARIDAAAETARRFLDGLAYQAWLRHAEQGVRLAEEAVAAVGRRVGAGAAPAAELARAEAELVRAELRYEDYEHELASAYRRLGAQWGETEPDFAVVVGMLESLPRVDSLDSLIARIDANPDIARLVSEQRIRETQVALARAQSRPSWRVSGGLRRNESTDDFGLVGSVTVPLRLGNRNQGRIAEARAGLARTEAEAVAASVDIETELFVLHQALEHDIHIAGRLVADVVPRLQSALGDARRSFELGRSSYLELRAVQTELLDVNAELLEAYTDAHRLTIEIERLTGASISPSVTQ